MRCICLKCQSPAKNLSALNLTSLVKKPFLIILLCAGLIHVINLQAQDVEGLIQDSKTKKPLAFVNIVYTSWGQGTVSNIDGEFSVSSSRDIEFLKFSFVGYHTKYISLAEIIPGKKILVKLIHKTYDIEEVKVLPGVNPAHRIIHLATENRKLNNPEKMQSFSYTSYSKMYFTLDIDSLKAKSSSRSGDTDAFLEVRTETSPADSTDVSEKDDLEEIEDFLEDNHLFLMEFVSERGFMHPDKNSEVVTASRVSGFKDPSFTMLATQIQSFSFYDDLLMLWDRKYLNPISRGSTRKYLFIIEDTTYTEQHDSLFVISYRPLKGKNFDGLEGILHINSNGYAIQNVIAEASETKGIFRVRIQQKYEHIDNQQWFPVQLNTDIMISPEEAKVNGQPMTLVGVGKSYLSDIKLNPEFKRRNFNHIEVEVEDDAHKKNDAYWDQYRVNPLTRKDTNTYRLIDSLGEEAKLDRSLKILETFASGYIPAGYFNIDYKSLIHWNQYEGFRLGIALETSDKISRWIHIGGKVAYGTRDKDLKYGSHLKVNLNRRRDAFLKLTYNKDVVESAGWRFVEKPPITSSEVFRSFLIANKDKIEEKSVEMQFPALRYIKLNTYLNQNVRQVTTDYRYQVSTPEGVEQTDRFKITEAGIMLKYAYKEKFLETPRGNRLSLGTNYPIIYANLHVGLPIFGGDYEYTKVEGKITKTFISKSMGDTKLALVGGWTDRSLPYPILYAGAGSYGVFTIETENSFATMRLNEFVSDRFSSIHFQQDFGKLLFKWEKFQPGIVLAASAGYGTIRADSRHINMEQNTLEKGYYESGILFNNLLRHSILGYGLGVFYRLGPYTLPKTIDNFAFKFTMRFNL
ncbi:MAG TPA: carboxypeptidase-like regulatory domain-containing protein [Bacteroides sp.]|nr:carboxypeptidase-like regulatory domain-containing protein [Bacteroides sp.]